MNPALNTAATGMAAQQTRTEVIANNLANVNTTGFKRSRAQFEDLLYQTMQGAAGARQLRDEHGARDAGRTRHAPHRHRALAQSQGALEQTGRSLDVAIDGDGLFPVQHVERTGVVHARRLVSRSLIRASLVTSDGYDVDAGHQDPRRTRPNVTDLVERDRVARRRAGGESSTELGRIELARFANPAGLLGAGREPVPARRRPPGTRHGLSGRRGLGQRGSRDHLEGSNVDIVQEMVDMINAQRAYEINSKAISNSDTMMGIANNLVR